MTSDCRYCAVFSQCKDDNKGYIENCIDFIEEQHTPCNEDEKTDLLRYGGQ